MPIAKIVRSPVVSKYQELEDALVQEWVHPQYASKEPVIIEDDEDNEAIQIYVIWSRWLGLDEIERSEVIARASERARGRGYVLQVMSASGLTPEEAERAGIEYAPLEAAA